MWQVIIIIVTTASFERWICRSTWPVSRETASTAWTATVVLVFSASTPRSTSSSWRLSTASMMKCYTWCAMPSWSASPSLRTCRRKAIPKLLCTLSRTRRHDLDLPWSAETLRWIVCEISVDVLNTPPPFWQSFSRWVEVSLFPSCSLPSSLGISGTVLLWPVMSFGQQYQGMAEDKAVTLSSRTIIYSFTTWLLREGTAVLHTLWKYWIFCVYYIPLK